MSQKTTFERLRIILSRVAMIPFIFVLLTSNSIWEKNSEILEVILFAAGILLVAIASLGRLWCSLYIAGYKTETLVTDGPYSICRNPLYFFSFLGAIGVGLATETFTLPIIFAALFAAYYPWIIKKEEGRLVEIHGDNFKDYKKSTPPFFPKLSLLREPETYSVNPIIFRDHILSALWFVWVVGLLEIIEGFHELHMLPTYWHLF